MITGSLRERAVHSQWSPYEGWNMKLAGLRIYGDLQRF